MLNSRSNTGELLEDQKELDAVGPNRTIAAVLVAKIGHIGELAKGKKKRQEMKLFTSLGYIS